MNRYIRTALSLAAALAWACAAAAEAPPKPAKKPLDHAAYDVWNTITASSISPDGKWVLYTVKPGKGDAVTHVRPTGAGPVYSAKRAASARFTRDSRYVIYLVQPEEEVVKKARAAKKPDEALPKSRLEILELDTGKKVTVPRVQSFRLPEKAAGWVAYLRERPVPPRREQAPMPREAEDDQAPAKPAPKPRLGEKEKKSRGRDRKPGSELVLRNLKTGAEFRYPDVVSYAFSRNGKRLALATSAEKAEDDGVFVVGVGKG
ncbi:MAG TPA: hypothetical protein VIL46_01510, partial [Gemmataceae bacterium]